MSRPIALILALATLTPAPILAQELKVSGSSTVYLISQAVARRYRQQHTGAEVDVKFTGSTGGFRALIDQRSIDVAGASRPIRAAELARARAAGIELIELPIAYDGLTVVTSASNRFIDYLSVDELKRIWAPGSTIRRWSEVRRGWPDRPIVLYGPGANSGTLDTFAGVICGSKTTREDYVASEDDDELVQGVGRSDTALGYFGYAYFKDAAGALRAIPIGPNRREAVGPSALTIRDGSYRPLSRPLFIYVRRRSLETAQVARFVSFYLAEAAELSASAGYVPLREASYRMVKTRLRERKAGSAFSGRSGSVSVLDVLKSADAPAPVQISDEDWHARITALRAQMLTLTRKLLAEDTRVAELERELAKVQRELGALRKSRPEGTTGGR